MDKKCRYSTNCYIHMLSFIDNTLSEKRIKSKKKNKYIENSNVLNPPVPHSSLPLQFTTLLAQYIPP